MVSKNYTNIPSQTFSWRSYCSAAIGTMSFWLLSSWHGCWLQSTVGIVSRTGTAVGCPSPSSPWAANQQPQLFSTLGWRKQHGNARRPGNTGYHSKTALTMHTFVGPEPRCSLHPSWLCLPSNDPQLSVPAGVKVHSWLGQCTFSHLSPESPYWLMEI